MSDSRVSIDGAQKRQDALSLLRGESEAQAGQHSEAEAEAHASICVESPGSAKFRASDLALYLVTDAALCGPRGVAETVRLAVGGGVTFVQLREKHAGFAEQLRQLEALVEVTSGRARLVVNDRLDVAIAARERGLPVDGVHLGQGDEAVLRARAELGPDAVIGLSANTDVHLEALKQLPAGTVDYLGVGAIHPTSTKPDHPPVLGVNGFAAFARATQLPCVAIGGIAVNDAALLRAAGAAGVAVVSALCAAEDSAAAAREFHAAWNSPAVS